MSMFFGAHFQMGASIIPRSLLQEDEPGIANVVDEEWILADRSPGLKAITAHFIANLPVHGIALQMIHSLSLFEVNSSRNANITLATTTVRRSTRSNKYDGFKVNQANDIKQTRSRVRARVLPSVKAISMAATPAQVASASCLPPTSIEEIQ